MAKFVLVSVIGIGAAILLGYVGGAAMATDLGRVTLAALAALIVLVGLIEGAQMISSSRA